MLMRSNTQKVSMSIVSLKNSHTFAHLSLEEYDLMVTWHKKSFSILN
jgi:hypothetical protein